MREEPLSPEVEKVIRFIATALPNETNWLSVKKQLMLDLCPGDRQLFSTRHDIKHLHYPFNTFEQRIRSLWKEITGNVLLMPDRFKMKDADPEGYL
jgi:hypothetical protein